MPSASLPSRSCSFDENLELVLAALILSKVREFPGAAIDRGQYVKLFCLQSWYIIGILLIGHSNLVLEK